ncbi:MAG: tripartite tricarboxylate transporter substrate binding protein [Burkholderiales bacterium]|nr:tripartite tricarboxylate transporter substrate binding protein [Burkholderiales bacterium]
MKPSLPSKLLRSRPRVLAALVTSCLTAAVPTAAFAQSYPNKAITFVVPAAPGGILDQAARLVASELTKVVNQPVVVENKAGASQIIGAQAVARAEPDGYTLLMGSIGPNAAHYGIYPKLPYTPNDFAPVVHVISMPNVLLVNPGVPAQNVGELVALAKAKPGALVLGSSGTATSGHLGAELLKSRAGIDLTLTDLIGGQVQVMVDNLVTAAPQIKAGRVRALAVTSPQRVPEFPDLPTIAESGYPGFDVTVWVGFMAPGKTPPAVIETLHREITKLLAQPHVKQRIAEMGGVTMSMSSAQFSNFVRTEIDKWGAVAKQANIKPD